MKIASVSFNWGADQVGGAQVPSVGFYQLAKILGHECDLIGCSASGNPPSDLVSWQLREDLHFNVKIVQNESLPDLLNKYDFIFLGTPGPMKHEDFPSSYAWSKINKPYVMMIHGETDNEFYGAQRVKEIFDHFMCKAFVSVDYAKKFWKEYQKKPELFWYPCTITQFMTDESTAIIYDKEEGTSRKGLVYAARLASWKNPELLARLTHDEKFMAAVDNKVDVHGITSNPETGARIAALNPIWNKSEDFYTIYNTKAVSKKFKGRKFFWDVNGLPNRPIEIPRLNLAAYEAMSRGCIVLADHSTVAPFIRDFTVDFNGSSGAITLLESVSKNFPDVREQFIHSLIKSPVSYYGALRAVKQIIEVVK